MAINLEVWRTRVYIIGWGISHVEFCNVIKQHTSEEHKVSTWGSINFRLGNKSRQIKNFVWPNFSLKKKRSKISTI